MIDNRTLPNNRFVSRIPDEPKNLTTAVKDYQVWLGDQSKSLVDPDFERLKERIIREAIILVRSGKLVDLET